MAPPGKGGIVHSSKKNVNDLHRLLKEIELLRGHNSWTPARFGTLFGISERTVRRDMQKLIATGFGVRFDRTRRAYYLEGGSFLPPVELSLDEALALVVLCEDVAGRGQVGLLGAAVSALSKVESQLPEAFQRRLRGVMDTVAVRLAPSGSIDQESRVFEQMRLAIAERRIVRCQYVAAGRRGEARTLELEPYVVWFGVRAWYVIGRHRERKDLVALKLRRFQSVVLTKRKFRRPAGFSVEDYLRNAWQMIPGDRDYEVEVCLDAAFGPTAADTRWHHTQEVVHHADGSVTMRLTVSGLEEIVWWVLSMGSHCVVMKPAELANRVRREVKAMHAAYARLPIVARKREGAGWAESVGQCMDNRSRDIESCK